MVGASTDWRAQVYLDRLRLLDEIHRRSPQPIGPVARVSFMCRAFPTLEEDFVRAVEARYGGASGVRETISELVTDAKGTRKKLVRALTRIMEDTRAARSARPASDVEASQHMAALRKARWRGAEASVFDPTARTGATNVGPDTKQLRLNWPQPTTGGALRLSWELFSNNQNFTVLEDLGERDQYDGVFLKELVGGTALDSFGASLTPEHQWSGELMFVSHYWIAPLAWILERKSALPTDDVLRLAACADDHHGAWTDAQRQAFLVMADYAREVFRNTGSSNEQATSADDFVFSAIADGRAFLLSDLRARGAEESRLPFRTIILDGGLTPEQRGRIVRYASDIEVYRTLSLRGYPLIETLDGAIGKLSFEVKTAELVRKQRDKNYRQILDVLSALNFFVTHGISGALLTSSTFGDLVTSRTKSLRERRIPGYSTLSSFLRHFHGSLGNIQRVAQRYDLVRRRISEAMDFIRAEAQRRATSSQLWLTGVGLPLAGLAVFAPQPVVPWLLSLPAWLIELLRLAFRLLSQP